jgi:hypothetical protein
MRRLPRTAASSDASNEDIPQELLESPKDT